MFYCSATALVYLGIAWQHRQPENLNTIFRLPILIQNITRNIANSGGQSSSPTTHTGLAVGAGRQPQQSEPTNQNNGRNSNSQA